MRKLDLPLDLLNGEPLVESASAPAALCAGLARATVVGSTFEMLWYADRLGPEGVEHVVAARIVVPMLAVIKLFKALGDAADEAVTTHPAARALLGERSRKMDS
jgi:hypothetical protein